MRITSLEDWAPLNSAVKCSKADLGARVLRDASIKHLDLLREKSLELVQALPMKVKSGARQLSDRVITRFTIRENAKAFPETLYL